MRPTGRPSRSARKYSARACSKNGFFRRFRNCLRSNSSGATQLGASRYRRNGSRMNRRRAPVEWTGRISSDPMEAGRLAMPTAIDVFSKVRGHERAEQLRAAREADLLPYFRTLQSPAAPVVEMEGAERIMLGSNNYLGLTADPRVMAGALDALERYGTGLTGSRLLNGTIGLHLELES